MATTTRAALYLRVSLDVTGEELAVTRQREDCLKIIQQRGWTLVGEYVDNSISASDRHKQRPAYNEMVEAYEAGHFDALVCWDLDRLTRQPRQLEDWIDAAEQRGLRLVTANGEADLQTDAGRLFARIKAAVARSEIERKSARQKRAQRQRAEQGKGHGIRLTGYDLQGNIIPEEAELVRGVFNGFLAGDTLAGMAARLNEQGVKTRRGGQWRSSSLSTMLQNPRYAGRNIYYGETVGDTAAPAIISGEKFDAVQVKLSDPRRKTNQGETARKHLGSGVYLCECGRRMRASGSGKSHRNNPSRPIYKCLDECYSRSGVQIDAYVLQVIRGRLAMPDLKELLARPADEAEMTALSAERATLAQRLESIEADYDEGVIDGRRYRTATDKVQARLADVTRKQAALMSGGALASVATAEDPVEAFDAAPLAVRQRIIADLADITLHPGARGKVKFDPASVTVQWLA